MKDLISACAHFLAFSAFVSARSRRLPVWLGLILAVVFVSSGHAQIPAFPGAQGFGAYATGGAVGMCIM